MVNSELIVLLLVGGFLHAGGFFMLRQPAAHFLKLVEARVVQHLPVRAQHSNEDINATVPAAGTKLAIEKFLMMYTCKLCSGRNTQMISKVAYNHGIVISTCKHCRNKHFIADNEGKLDMEHYGKKIEDYLVSKGETVQRMHLTPQDIQSNYLIDQDGTLNVVPRENVKAIPTGARIVDFPLPDASVNS